MPEQFPGLPPLPTRGLQRQEARTINLEALENGDLEGGGGELHAEPHVLAGAEADFEEFQDLPDDLLEGDLGGDHVAPALAADADVAMMVPPVAHHIMEDNLRDQELENARVQNPAVMPQVMDDNLINAAIEASRGAVGQIRVVDGHTVEGTPAVGSHSSQRRNSSRSNNI
jgi:hypothetical protein